MPRSYYALQDTDSINEFLNAVATETAPLFERFEYEFLLTDDVFTLSKRGGEYEFTSH